MGDDSLLWKIVTWPPVYWFVENFAWWATPVGAVFLWHYKKKVDAGDARVPLREQLVEHLESTAERSRAMIATINKHKYTYPETRAAMIDAKQEFDAMRGDLAALKARPIVAEVRQWHADMFALVDLIEREDAAVWKMLNMGHMVGWAAPAHVPVLEGSAKRIEALLKRAERLRLYPWWTWPIRK